MLTFREAKASAVDAFERKYLENLIRFVGGGVSRMARVASMERGQLRSKMRRHGLAIDWSPPAGIDDAEFIGWVDAAARLPLTGRAHLSVLLYLGHRCRSGSTWPLSMASISADTGIPYRTVENAIGTLIRGGYIERQSVMSSGSVYVVNFRKAA